MFGHDPDNKPHNGLQTFSREHDRSRTWKRLKHKWRKHNRHELTDETNICIGGPNCESVVSPGFELSSQVLMLGGWVVGFLDERVVEFG